VLERAKSDPAYQAFLTLRVGFTVLPIVMGIDKFFNNLVNWEQYLAHWIANISPLSATGTMHVVGIVEIAAGVLGALTLARLASAFDPPLGARSPDQAHSTR
jgi:uncharacterized membrane protein YphA (DoxX/SURF4 family)